MITSRIVDLVSEGIDLAVRLGPLKDSSLIARLFASARAGLWASADYLAAVGPSDVPETWKITSLWCSAPRFRGRSCFRGVRNSVDLFHEEEFHGRAGMLRLFAVLGEGIALLPEFLARATQIHSKDRLIDSFGAVLIAPNDGTAPLPAPTILALKACPRHGCGGALYFRIRGSLSFGTCRKINCVRSSTTPGEGVRIGIATPRVNVCVAKFNSGCDGGLKEEECANTSSHRCLQLSLDEVATAPICST